MVCNNSVLDLVFVVDSSGSIEEANPTDGSFDNYELLKTFVSNIIGLLDIGEDKVRVGLVRFSNFVNSEFYLNTTFVKSELQNRVLNMDFIGGTTNTSGALREMRLHQFVEVNGDRPDVPNVAVIITDGASNEDQDQTIPEAQLAHEAGIQIISVGITDKINRTELEQISSPPQELGKNYFVSDDFMSLNVEVKNAFVTETCSSVAGKFLLMGRM